ncbi:MAG: NYN domain-containing protein [Huintestinicola sp.]
MEPQRIFAAQRRIMTTAILVDGAFYRKRAKHYIGDVTPEERAEELAEYCHRLLTADNHETRNLYRIFYYDCPPLDKNIFNPITNRSVNLGKSDEFKWMTAFLQELKHQRKFALRLGRLSENAIEYSLKYESLKKLLNGTMNISEITAADLSLNIEQKGVDMRIGVDITSLAFKKQVNQIILISGDSDFVPAAKQARREGIDFLLNPLGAPIKSDLFEHIDGLIKWVPKKYKNKAD